MNIRFVCVRVIFYFAIQFPHTRRVKAEGYKELTAMEKGETLWLLTSSSSSSSS